MRNNFNGIFWVILLSLALHGCAGGPERIKKSVDAGRSLQAICEERKIAWQWDNVSQVFSFSNAGVLSRVLVGSNLVIVGDKRVILSDLVVRKDNLILVPADFSKKIFDDFLSGPDRPSEILVRTTGKFREIMIDAGHGGKDPGALGLHGAVEKEITLDIAMRLKSQLQLYGFKVSMTREHDEYLSLPQRTEMATASQADLFVSIHANATKSMKIKGLEIYYSRTLEREKDLRQRDINQNALIERLNISASSHDSPGRIIADMLYSYKFSESERLADYMIETASRHIDASSRGSRPCGFFVVKNTLIPAVLFEVGYISNSVEAKLLQSEDYRQKIAESIAVSIKEYSDET